MHILETLARLNAEWPFPLTHRERRAAEVETAIQQLESRLDVAVDRNDQMLGAMAVLELSMIAKHQQETK